MLNYYYPWANPISNPHLAQYAQRSYYSDPSFFAVNGDRNTSVKAEKPWSRICPLEFSCMRVQQLFDHIFKFHFFADGHYIIPIGCHGGSYEVAVLRQSAARTSIFEVKTVGGIISKVKKTRKSSRPLRCFRCRQPGQVTENCYCVCFCLENHERMKWKIVPPNKFRTRSRPAWYIVKTMKHRMVNANPWRMLAKESKCQPRRWNLGIQLEPAVQSQSRRLNQWSGRTRLDDGPK